MWACRSRSPPGRRAFAWSASISIRKKSPSINAGKSYLRHIPGEEISAAVSAGRLRATTRFAEVRDVDAIIICVPTPLTAHREPDLSYVESTTEAIAPHLRKGQLIVLESTTWPGTTTEVMQPILERGGLKSGQRFLPRVLARARGSRAMPATRPNRSRRVVGARRPGRDQARQRALRRDRAAQVDPGLIHEDRGSGQAHREHFPRRQHRARQRTQGHLRRHGHRRLGSDRGRQDQAVRLHAVLSRARASAATASRSTRSI